MSLLFPFEPDIARASTIPARLYNYPAGENGMHHVHSLLHQFLT